MSSFPRPIQVYRRRLVRILPWVLLLAACTHADLRPGRGAAKGAFPSVLRGVVLDERSGTPLEEAEVALCDAIYDPPEDTVGTAYFPTCVDELATASTRADGSFELRLSGAGRRALLADGALIAGRMSHLGSPYPARYISSRSLREAPGGRLEVRLQQPARLTVRGRSPEGQAISLFQAGWFRQATRGLRVHHSFVEGAEHSSGNEGLAPGPVTVYLVEQGPLRRYATAKKVHLRSGATTSLTLTLSRTLARARLRLTDRAGLPLSLVKVRPSPIRPSAFERALMAIHKRHVEPGLDGELEINAERAGPLRISVLGWRYRPDAEPNLVPVVLAEQELQLAKTDTGVVRVGVNTTQVTSCSLVDRSGQALPIRDYRVKVVDPPRSVGIHSGGDFEGTTDASKVMPLRFPWIAGARKISVRLKRGDQRNESDGSRRLFSGSLVLNGPGDPCVIVSH